MRGLGGQLRVGLLLGAVWSPCGGPTLGAASVLAAQSGGAGTATLTMASFGLGAALPLGLIGPVSRAAVRWRGVALHGGKSLKIAMGLALIVIGARGSCPGWIAAWKSGSSPPRRNG